MRMTVSCGRSGFLMLLLRRFFSMRTWFIAFASASISPHQILNCELFAHIWPVISLLHIGGMPMRLFRGLGRLFFRFLLFVSTIISFFWFLIRFWLWSTSLRMMLFSLFLRYLRRWLISRFGMSFLLGFLWRLFWLLSLIFLKCWGLTLLFLRPFLLLIRSFSPWFGRAWILF